MIRSFFTVAFVMLLSSATSVQADDTLSFTDKTYFTLGKYDRIYFAEDGQFFQQLENDWDNVTTGDLLEGEWTFDKEVDTLCMEYTTLSSMKDIKNCFKVEQDGENYSASLNDQLVFEWSGQRVGNWLLSQGGMTMMLNIGTDANTHALDDVKAYISDKVLTGWNDVISYTMPSGDNGHFRDQETGDLKPFTNQYEDGLIISTVDSGVNEVVLWTLGKEFKDDKPEQIYFYADNGTFTTESDEVFNFTPLEESEHKDMFTPLKIEIKQ